MDRFSPLARECLGWYVYLLLDPRTDVIFYVGKGRGDRAFRHEASALDNVDHPELQSAKAARILAIAHDHEKVAVAILRHAISSEHQAYEVESAAIDLINRLTPGTLLNVVLGHHQAQHGLMPAEEIEVLYAAPKAPPLKVPVMLVSLNRLWRPGMTEEQLHDITHGWWHARGKRRDLVQYVFGVHNGVVRTVYRPTNWRARQEGDRGWEDPVGKRQRWGFEGHPAPEMAHYLHTSVSRFLNATQWSFLYVGPEES